MMEGFYLWDSGIPGGQIIYLLVKGQRPEHLHLENTDQRYDGWIPSTYDYEEFIRKSKKWSGNLTYLGV